jgi:hypothetical protein
MGGRGSASGGGTAVPRSVISTMQRQYGTSTYGKSAGQIRASIKAERVAARNAASAGRPVPGLPGWTYDAQGVSRPPSR